MGCDGEAGELGLPRRGAKKRVRWFGKPPLSKGLHPGQPDGCACCFGWMSDGGNAGRTNDRTLRPGRRTAGVHVGFQNGFHC